MAALVSQYCMRCQERTPEADLRHALTEYLTAVGRRSTETYLAAEANDLLALLAEEAGLRWEFWLPGRKLPDMLIYGRGLSVPTDENIFLVLGVGVAMLNPMCGTYTRASEVVREVLRYMGHERGRVRAPTLRECESMARKWVLDELHASNLTRTFEKLDERGARLMRVNPLVTLPGPRLKR